MNLRTLVFPGLLCLVGLASYLSYANLLLPSYLTFSDTAKVADIARNLVSGKGLGSSYAFFFPEALTKAYTLFPLGTPPFYPFFLALGFHLFGVSDQTVSLCSGFLYLGCLLALFGLAKTVFNQRVGFLVALLFALDLSVLNYATAGASEILFVLELLVACWFLYLDKPVTWLGAGLTMLLAYFTRPSAIIYIAVFGVFFLANHLSKKKLGLVLVGLLAGWLILELGLALWSNGYIVYSPLQLFFQTLATSSQESTSNYLRGAVVQPISLKLVVSKIFYNLYNFYKALPQIYSPYLVLFYLLSLFRPHLSPKDRRLRWTSLALLLATLFATAATVPLYRYLFPALAFVYLFALEEIFWLVSQVTPRKAFALVFGLVLFIIGPTLGKIGLDSRALQDQTNPALPPVYVKLAESLQAETQTTDIIITNLDTWGSWYGQRKTLWYPLRPAQLLPLAQIPNPYTVIYLTSYKMDDQNYYMGPEWRQAFLNPTDIADPFIKDHYLFAKKIEIPATATYTKESATAVLFVKK